MSDTIEQLQNIISIMAKLRDPDTGCPWDVKQDFATIAPYTIEEAYEVVDAIERGDRAAICDELGDLLLQVVFHARIAEEEGSFTLADVARSISDKMINRHPHVFGDRKRTNVDQQRQLWEDIKQILGTNMDLAAPFLFRKIIAGGRKLITMKSYLNQPKKTKVFKQVFEDLGIEEPRRFRNWQGRLETQLRF